MSRKITKGKMIGTCGHEITIEDLKGLRIKDWDRELKPCIRSMAVCEKCRQWFEAEGCVTHNEEEEQDWFKEKF